MSRLKQKAKKDFWAVCVITFVGLLMFGFLTYVDIKGARGARYLIIGLLYAGACVGFMLFQNKRRLKKQNIPDFDEREFSLILRAINIGNNTFIAFVLLVTIIAFYLIGGQGMAPMWSIPLALYCCIFLSGTVQSLVLMYYAKEDDE